MDRWKGRTAVITGSFSGIGGGITKALLKQGMNVVGCEETLERLDEFTKSLEGPGVFVPVKCDVRIEEEILTMFEVAKEKFGGVDVCVNNAGCGRIASILEGKTTDWKTLMDISILGMSICTREAVKSMKEKGVNDGHIINIGSIFGHYVPKGFPSSNMYTAVKAAAIALTEGTRNELCSLGKGFRVTVINPGYVDTNFDTNMRGAEAAKKAKGNIKCMQPEDIADAVVYILGAPPHVQVTTLVIETTEPWP